MPEERWKLLRLRLIAEWPLLTDLTRGTWGDQQSEKTHTFACICGEMLYKYWLSAHFANRQFPSKVASFQVLCGVGIQNKKEEDKEGMKM